MPHRNNGEKHPKKRKKQTRKLPKLGSDKTTGREIAENRARWSPSVRRSHK